MPDRREFIGYIGSGTIWKVSALDAGGGESLGTQSSRGVSDSEDPAEEPTADALFRDEFNDGTFEDQWSYVEDQRHQGSSVVEAGTTLRHVTPQNYGSNKPIRTDSTIETSGTHRIVMRARTNRSDYNGWGIGVRGEQGGVALKNNKWGPFDRFAVFGVTERPDKYASDHGGSEQPNRAKLAPATSETSFSTYSITVDFDDNTVTRVQRDSRTWELSLPTGEIGDSYQLKIPIGGGHDVEYDFVTVIEVTAGAAPFTRIEVTPSPPAVNSSVNFTAANATASEGRTVSSYEWDFTGDDTVDATGREVSHTFREPGTYTIAVTLTDSEGVTATATKEISVIGAPSVAVDVTPTDPVTGVPVTFDATSATADEERKLTSHEWDITGDGTVDATGEEVTHSFAEPGTYAVTLTVTDSEGATATTTRDITVVAPPSADIELSSASPTVDRPVTLTATNVTAGGDRTVATYEWDFAGDGTIDATGEEVTHSFAEPGTYTVTLTVTDSEGATATTTREITVIAAPSAVIEVRPSDPVAGELITFSATDSTVAQSRSLTGFEWAFGDDNTFTESEDIVIRRFGESGNYTVRLRVTDSAGVSDTTSVTVTVDQPPSPTPTAPPTPTVSPTPTETPTKTPTETPTPEPASALGTGMSLRELLLGGVGVTGLGILGGVAYRRRSGGEETDSNSGSDTTPGEQAYELAEPALEEADTARQSGDYETAIDQYDEAITQYEIARDRLPTGDDRQEEIEYALSTTRESLRELQDYVETRSDVTEMLTTAESDLQTALTGHTGGEVTVPELRYRQARDRYKKVLDTITDSDHDLFEDGPIEITRDTATATPPQDIENVPAYGDGQTLAEAGIDSAEAFVDADDDTLSTLADVHQMVATAWWDSEVTTTFASRADIETRREIAQRGFDQI